MKFVMYESAAEAAGAGPGLLTPRGVVPVGDMVAADSPQEALENLIDAYEELRPRLESLATAGRPIALADVRLLAPVPLPGKILCSTAVFTTPAAAEPQQ